MPKKLVLVCLLNFFIAALLGLLLRYSFINPIGLNYRFLTHTHSHVAMLGWVYLMLFTLIVHYFVPDKKAIFNRLFWLTELAVIGMLLSFPFQGYAAVSISFSTLHIICSYYFAFLIFKHHKTENIVTSYLLKASVIFMLLSTIGVWCLGPAVAIVGTASSFYQIAIQFFLHFQFNGWFIIAVLAVFFNKLQLHDSKDFRLFFMFLIISTVLTFALPVNWFEPHIALIWINAIGVLFQLIALFYFMKMVKPAFGILIEFQDKLTRFMYRFALACFVLKIVLQSVSLIPEVATMAYQHRNFTIGFIHLTMLGVVSGFLFAFLLQCEFVKHSIIVTFGIYAFVLGFLFTEVILFVQGCFFYVGKGLLPNYYLLLFLSSILLPLGIGSLIFSILNTTNQVKEAYETP